MLPLRYQWLAREPGPRMIVEALKLFGTLEGKGATNNLTIFAWAQEVGGDVADVYKADSIPWCGLFMAVVAKRADKVPPPHPLWALSWAAFGQKIDKPMLGDVLVFTRAGGGHVALYVGEDDDCFHILGGNQSDQVCIVRKPKAQLYAARRPSYRVQPANVRRVMLAATGELSLKED
jgi:uncharacterized protein (TIGR02594 family)